MSYLEKLCNTTAPCLSILELYKETQNEKYRELLEDFAQWCMEAYQVLKANIAEDGTVLNASGGTCIMPTKEEYNAIECCYSPFAQGLAILAVNSFELAGGQKNVYTI